VENNIAPRLLLVEDNPVNIQLMCRRLERQGYEVVVAADGETAIALAEDQSLDLVLMDISLPGLDGWQVTQKLRKMDRTAAVPIIALTAHTSAEDRQHCLDSGCNDYELKPVNFEQLLKKVERLLQ
jgi:two-component system, cell cycle response regulator DivK